MSFLYPLFLAASAALAIPVLIHLFNLRRYKTVFFPHTRFLKNIQLSSRRQSQIRYKWLLAARLLFLSLLILAFAQPFFNSKDKNAGARLQVIYLDNSYSMAANKGVRSLLDIAKDAALRQVRSSAAGIRFVLLTNDKTSSYRPAPPDKVISDISAVSLSPVSLPAGEVFQSVQSLLQSESVREADLYFYSDFQQSTFEARPDNNLLKHIHFYGIPVQSEKAEHTYIDTAFLATPLIQTGTSNQLIVKTKLPAGMPKEMPVLQLTINGQVKNAASLTYNKQPESFEMDTLSFTVNDASWQQIALTVNDAGPRYDDTFRIAARSTPGLSILVLNEGQPNPYIQAAFHAYNGFRLNQADLNATGLNWNEYNLVILNGITRINDSLAKKLSGAMLHGQSVCLFPGLTHDLSYLNTGLKQIGDLSFSGMDTSVQTVTNLQQGSSLVKDLFEKIPENVQLPLTNWHYIIQAGLTASQQSVMSFRNGDPFFAQYAIGRGHLYLCAASADLQSGNFPGSYFFVPFLYQMAVLSRSGDVFALTSGSREPLYLSLQNADERNMVHIYGKGTDIIPPQRPAAAGLDIFVDGVIQDPGFYRLSAAGTDTTIIALNVNRAESDPRVWNLSQLRDQWKQDNIKWSDIASNGKRITANEYGGFPLWKVCVILALLMLAAETFLLAGFHKQTVAAQ